MQETRGNEGGRSKEGVASGSDCVRPAIPGWGAGAGEMAQGAESRQRTEVLQRCVRVGGSYPNKRDVGRVSTACASWRARALTRQSMGAWAPALPDARMRCRFMTGFEDLRQECTHLPRDCFL